MRRKTEMEKLVVQGSCLEVIEKILRHWGLCLPAEAAG